MAQIYYERALKEESQAVTPVYLLSIYGKWQRLNFGKTLLDVTGAQNLSIFDKSRLSILASLGFYVISLVGIIKILRRPLNN
jgi:hypothetical protein